MPTNIVGKAQLAIGSSSDSLMLILIKVNQCKDVGIHVHPYTVTRKASIGMYHVCDYPTTLVCVLFGTAIPT